MHGCCAAADAERRDGGWQSRTACVCATAAAEQPHAQLLAPGCCCQAVVISVPHNQVHATLFVTRKTSCGVGSLGVRRVASFGVSGRESQSALQYPSLNLTVTVCRCSAFLFLSHSMIWGYTCLEWRLHFRRLVNGRFGRQRAVLQLQKPEVSFIAAS